jgi:hypothetical protein
MHRNLQWIVRGNETWVCYYEPASKHQSMEWKYTSPRIKKFNSVLSAGRVMVMPFWDFNRPILKHYQDHGQMVNRVQYCDMLEKEMKPTTCSTC